ncbi:MAG: hypothetical protein PHS57_07100 [Alphaproteobacteria bacterium]|nr:hypothetical protein [Alphaproteobacteria bacterium]
MLNLYAEDSYDYATASAFSGPPVDLTLAEFIKIFEANGNQKWRETCPTFEQLKAMHHEMYLDRIIAERQTPNPLIVEAIKKANDKGIPCIIVSNGTDEGIRKLLNYWKLDSYFGGEMTLGTYTGGKIFAYDSKNKIAENGTRVFNRLNEHGEREADKTKYMASFVKQLGLTMADVIAFEDSEGTCGRMVEAGAYCIYISNGHNRPNPPVKKSAVFSLAPC